MTDTGKAIWHYVQQKPADELGGRQAHAPGFRSPFAVAVILPLKRHLVFGHVEDAVIRESHPVRIAAEVFENVCRAAEGRFGVDDPLGVAGRRQVRGEPLGLAEIGEIAREAQLAALEGGLEGLQKQAAEQA